MNSLKVNRYRLLLISLVVALLSACGGSEEREAKYLEKAQAYFEEENYDKARVEAKNVLQINPKNTQARFLMGKVHQQAGEFREAFASFNSVVEEDDSFLDAHVEVAKILFAAKESDRAIAHVDTVLATRPKDKDARILKAGLLARENKLADAQRLAEEVLSEFPGEPGAIAVLAPIYSVDDPEKALGVINKGLELNPKNFILKDLKIVTLSRLKRADDVEQALLEITQENPKALRYFYRLARGYAFQNRLDEAEKILNQAVEGNPESSEPKIKLIEFLAQRKGIDKAEEAIKALITKEPTNFEYQEFLAQLYLQNNRVEDAKGVFKTIIANSAETEASATGLAAKNALASIHLTQNDRVTAERLIGEVFDVEENNTDALILQARIKLSQGDFDGAVADLRAALKSDSQSIDALKLLATAQERQGTTSLALDNYRRALVVKGDDMVALLGVARLSYREKQIAQAEKYLDRALQLEPTNQEAVALMVTVLGNQKQWDKAHQVLEPMLVNQPTRGAGLILQARLYRGESNWSAARVSYEQALELSPNAFEAIAGYVDTYLINKDFDGGIEFLKGHLQANPELHFAKDLLANVYLRKPDLEAAKKIYQDLIKELPNNEQSYQKLAAIHRQQKNHGKAEQVYLDGIKQNPKFASLRVYLANHYQQQSNYEEAKSQYEEVLKLNPDVDVAKNNLAVLLVNYFPSDDSFQKALALASEIKDQRQPVFMDTLGWVHYHLGNLPQAISYLEAATNQQSQIPEFQYHLGMAYHKNGQMDKAKQALQLATQDVQTEYYGLDEAKKVLQSL